MVQVGRLGWWENVRLRLPYVWSRLVERKDGCRWWTVAQRNDEKLPRWRQPTSRGRSRPWAWHGCIISNSAALTSAFTFNFTGRQLFIKNMQLNHLYALTPVYRRLQDYGPPSEYVRESKKRRRSLTPSEADESDDVNTNEDDDGEKSPKEAHPARVISSLSALTAEQAAQYRVAGLTPEEKIPLGHSLSLTFHCARPAS